MPFWQHKKKSCTELSEEAWADGHGFILEPY